MPTLVPTVEVSLVSELSYPPESVESSFFYFVAVIQYYSFGVRALYFVSTCHLVTCLSSLSLSEFTMGSPRFRIPDPSRHLTFSILIVSEIIRWFSRT